VSLAQETLQAFAPTGHLRASINLGNPVLASVDSATGQPEGVSIDLARGLAERLGVELELLVFDTAAKSVAALAENEADVGFFAIDPQRGKSIAFTAPYVLIEGGYMVRDDSPIRSNDDVDRAGRRVAVGNGSAYDLYLTRELRHAEIVRAPSSQTVVDVFVEQGLEVAAGVRQQLQADVLRFAGMRLLPGSFMVIRQAMGIAIERGPTAAAVLHRYVEEMKASGFIARSLVAHGVQGASVAPLE
jgi:polar amino acid transport system substrate-binding protein